MFSRRMDCVSPVIYLVATESTRTIVMDLKIQRPSPTCKTSGSEFKAGDLMFLRSFERKEDSFAVIGLMRRGQAPDETLAWWRSVVPEQK